MARIIGLCLENTPQQLQKLREVDYHYALGREALVAEKDY
jgi:hypothetical protein